MSREKKLSDEIKEVQKKQFKEQLGENSFVQMVRGIWVFAEGSALIVTAAYAIYQGWNAHMPAWGQDVLLVAGVLVLVPAAVLLSSFFRKVGRA